MRKGLLTETEKTAAKEIRDYQLGQLAGYTRVYLSVSETAGVLGISRTAVMELVESGDLNAWQRGKGCRWWISRDSVEKRIKALLSRSGKPPDFY